MKKLTAFTFFALALSSTSALAGACGQGTQPATTGNFCVFTPAYLADNLISEGAGEVEKSVE